MTYMQAHMLKCLHDGHLGMEKTRLAAREFLYWPKMNDAIHDMVKSCGPCQKHQHSQPKEPLMQHSKDSPWVKVGLDLFKIGKEH